jgi:hypothetical protein
MYKCIRIGTLLVDLSPVTVPETFTQFTHTSAYFGFKFCHTSSPFLIGVNKGMNQGLEPKGIF